MVNQCEGSSVRVPGGIIFLNGASSSGKTTIAKALQDLLPQPFLHFSIDHFRDAGILPLNRINEGDIPWVSIREAVFDAYQRSLRAIAEAGCNIIAEHIIEDDEWRLDLRRLLGDLDVFIVAVRCPPEELERRELQRGDRPLGDALRDAATCYSFCRHDIEVDSSHAPHHNATVIISQWLKRDSAQLSRFSK